MSVFLYSIGLHTHLIKTQGEPSIDEFKSVVNDFARDMDSAMISKAESMQVCSC